MIFIFVEYFILKVYAKKQVRKTGMLLFSNDQPRGLVVRVSDY